MGFVQFHPLVKRQDSVCPVVLKCIGLFCCEFVPNLTRPRSDHDLVQSTIPRALLVQLRPGTQFSWSAVFPVSR